MARRSGRFAGPIERIGAVDRGHLVLSFGLLLLALAAAAPWYVAPSTIRSAVGADGLLDLVEAEPPITLAYRAAVGFLAVGGAALLLIDRRRLLVWRRPAWLVLLACFWLPYLVNHWQPLAAKDTALLQTQVDRAIDDMEANLGQQPMAWRGWQVMVTALPQRGDLFEPQPVENWNLDLLAFHRQDQVVEDILGFSNGALNLLRRGWFLAIIGLSSGLLGCYLLSRPVNRLLRGDLRFAAASFVAMAIVLLLPRAFGEFAMQRGDDAFARGDMAEARAAWEQALAWKPAVDLAIAYHRRLGALDEARGCGSCPDAQLAAAHDSLTRKDYVGAATQLERVAASGAEFAGLRYWLAKALTEIGVDAFNDGQYGLAEQYWWQALHQVPIDAMAWYGLSLVHLRYGEFERAAAYADAVSRLESRFNFSRLTPQAQALQLHGWDAFRRRDLIAAHGAYSASLTPEDW